MNRDRRKIRIAASATQSAVGRNGLSEDWRKVLEIILFLYHVNKSNLHNLQWTQKTKVQTERKEMNFLTISLVQYMNTNWAFCCPSIDFSTKTTEKNLKLTLLWSICNDP